MSVKACPQVEPDVTNCNHGLTDRPTCFLWAAGAAKLLPGQRFSGFAWPAHASTEKMRVPPSQTQHRPVQIDTDDQAVAAFLSHLVATKNRRPRTLEAYGMALAKLREFLGPERGLLSAVAIELETFAGIWLHKRGVVARSRKPYISAVRGFYAWANARGLRVGDPARELLHPQIGRPLPHALSMQSAEKLMWAPDLNTFVGVRDATMLALLLGCGIRVGGLVGLDEDDVRNSEIDGAVRLVIRVVEKGLKERMLPVPKEAEMLLRIYLDHEELKPFDRNVVDAKGRPQKVLFVNTRPGATPAHEWHGERVRLTRQAVWRMIQRHGRRAGVPAEERHPHAFRHLFGVEMAEDDVDLITRQDLLGHSDPKSTAIYTSMAMRKKAKVIDTSGPLGKMRTPVSEVLKRL